ncbi:MAG: restriction endonuclease subunit S [Bacteroidales bacterium]|nr:restriction endonuclease subunit S [Bacteroidales bacterium]
MDYKRLGDYIREVNLRNRELRVTNLLGLSIEKKFIPSIANTIGTDMSAYKIVHPSQFAYVPVTSRNGEKITVALYDGEESAIISQAYTIFEIVDQDVLLPEYLMMWFRRPEFDRYARFHSHGSAREVFDWDELCEVRLPVPTLARQREIVSEYETLTRRIRLNEQMIAKLEETAQALYRKMFVDCSDKENLPEGWRRGTIGEFCDIITGKKDVNESLTEGKYRFFSCSPDAYYSNEFIAKGPAALIAGNGSYTGRVTYYDKEFDLYQRTYACIPKKGFMEMMSFIYCVLKFQFQNKFMGGSRGSSIPYIVRGDIADFEFAFEENTSKSFSKGVFNLLTNTQLKIVENEILTELQKILLSRMIKTI